MYLFYFVVGMAAFHPTFMTKFTTNLGPKTSVSVREYTDGRSKVCFNQTYFKKQQDCTCERTLTLSVDAWYKFERFLWQIEQVIDDIKNGGDSNIDIELSEDIRLRINASYPFINIRKFWCPPNREDMVPTTSGVCVKFDEYTVLKNVFPSISALLPDKPCEKNSRYFKSLDSLSIKE